MGDESAKVRVSFESRLNELKNLPKSPFAVPVALEKDGLSGVINHLLNLDKDTRFNFVVVDDGALLVGSLKDHLQSRGRSTETLVKLECIKKKPAPSPDATSEHPDWISSLSASNGLVATGCYDGSVRVYDASTCKFVANGAVHTEPVKDVAFLDGQSIVSVSKDSSAVIWRLEKGQLSSEAICKGHTNSIETVAARPSDGGVVCSEFATGGWDSVVRLWKRSPDGEDADDETSRAAKKRRTTNGETSDVIEIESTLALMGHSGSISSAAWLDKEKLCTGSWDRSIRLWDVRAGVCESTVHCSRVVCDIAVQPSSSLCCSTHPDGKARLWDLRIRDGANVVATRTFSGHKGWVSSVSWIDAQNFVTSGYDGSLVLWDFRGNKPVHRLSDVHKGKSLCVLAVGDGRKIVSGGSDGALRWLENATGASE